MMKPTASRNSGKASGSSAPITTAGHIQERSAGLRVARNQCQSKPDMTRMTVSRMATTCQTTIRLVKQPMRLRGTVTRNCFMRESFSQKETKGTKKNSFYGLRYLLFNRFQFDSQVRAGKDHANNSIGEFHFVEIDDESHGNIEQLHVTEQLRLVNG